MKLFSRGGRATLIGATGEIDVHEQSEGKFSARIEQLYPRWSDFSTWASQFGSGVIDMGLIHDNALDSVTPDPRQVLAIGLNYVDHAAESGFKVPDYPIVFTKFPSSIAGPFGDLKLTGTSVDWEVELVAVVGTGGRNISADRAFEHIAGFAIGQDYSDRDAQFRGQPSQFSLGKSFEGFAPIGPLLVSPEEFLAEEPPIIECRIDDEVVQSAPLSDMVFSVADLIEKLSAVVELLPGDAIFTGTPPGVGLGRSPQRYLQAGERVRSSISGLGYMEQRCV